MDFSALGNAFVWYNRIRNGFKKTIQHTIANMAIFYLIPAKQMEHFVTILIVCLTVNQRAIALSTRFY